jgi:hypothetical protein
LGPGFDKGRPVANHPHNILHKLSTGSPLQKLMKYED